MTETMQVREKESNLMPVNVVVAHGLEVKALIPMLRLRPQKIDSGYSQYSNSSGLCLIVSGIGKAAVTKAVACLAGQQANDVGQVRAWINIGIGGHPDADLGSGWLANKIVDQASGARAYPPQLIDGIANCSVITVDEPERAYPQYAVYEMEASAFFDEASKYATAEMVQVFKIISDNLKYPIDELDLRNVPKWISQREAQIVSLVERLANLVRPYNDSQAIPSAYNAICMQTHLTISQKLQLKRICQRYRALGREDELGSFVNSAASNSKQLIGMLTSQIDRLMETQ